MNNWEIENNGAIQVDLPTQAPVKVVLGGPIRYWWQEGNWDTDLHREYVKWRDDVRVALVKAGALVYSPHRALQGAWDEAAQQINDAAIRAFDVFLVLGPKGVQADGTSAEIQVAIQANKYVRFFPPGSDVDDVVRYCLDRAPKALAKRL